ncbi:MAG: hypothetical protein HYW48_07695 [Deltaproteobacteria bacterium]|nr:hypothetical protein [Deltaproteobacteria bacterium]
MNKAKKGTFILASTHIGNVEDTPLRTLAALSSADLLIFEEERPARRLLKLLNERHFGPAQGPLFPRPLAHPSPFFYNEHAPQETLAALRRTLKAGKTAIFVSDQGCPSLADPGQPLTEIAYEMGATVKVIPGPSAVTAAIAACPFPLANFFFAGFLPREEARRRRDLSKLASWNVPLIILDTPYRLHTLLESCDNVLGSKRQAFLAIDISGENEQFIVGNFARLRKLTEEVKKQNFVLIISL